MEIERKFLISSLPVDTVKDCECAHIEQYYLDYGSANAPEIRIRTLTKSGKTEYFYTEKSLGDLCREEEEYEISEYSYKRLKELAVSPAVAKARYYLPVGELVTEIDVYEGSLSGLLVAEIEFSSLEESDGFTPPEWFGEEITYDTKYKNKNLAKLI